MGSLSAQALWNVGMREIGERVALHLSAVDNAVQQLEAPDTYDGTITEGVGEQD